MTAQETIDYLNTQIDIYCERLGPGLFAEPLNALTNCAFFFAAAAAFTLAHRRRTLDIGIWLLVGLAIAIGVGSTLFHTFATRWAMILDVVPILVFQLGFLWLYLARVVRLSPWIATLATCAFLGLALAARELKEPLNGSVPYIPALLVVGGLGLYHFLRCEHERSVLFFAAAAFVLAFFFRSIDMEVCGIFPRGTHFLWHLLIATALRPFATPFAIDCVAERTFAPAAFPFTAKAAPLASCAPTCGFPG